MYLQIHKAIRPFLKRDMECTGTCLRYRTVISALFLLTTAVLSILAGCDGNTASFVDQSGDTASALQDAFDTSVKAEAYTNELFTSMLSEEGISQYEILLTTGGFITSDPLVYISGYQYSYDGKTRYTGINYN